MEASSVDLSNKNLCKLKQFLNFFREVYILVVSMVM